MELSEKPIVFGIMIACVLGIIIVGGFIAVTNLTGVFSGGPFSELYFDEHTELPNVIDKGEEINLGFTVAAHNNDPTHYTYTVMYDSEEIETGAFDLPTAYGEYKKNISICFAPQESSLRLLSEPAISYRTLDTDATIGMVYRDTATGAILEEEGYPVGLPIGGGDATLLFDKTQSEEFSTDACTLKPVGDVFHAVPSEDGVEIYGEQASNAGYDLTYSQWDITHAGDKTAGNSISTTMQYRYLFQKVSVEVKAYENGNPTEPTRYEIHFWVIVLEDPSVIQMLPKQSFSL